MQLSSVIVALLLVSASFGELQNPNLSPAEYSRVVVLPDIHGDQQALMRSIWLAVEKVEGLTPDFTSMAAAFDEYVRTGNYSGALLSSHQDVAVVQLGDIFDRGPYGVQCLHILAGIEKILGWRLLQLYGNHEVMNFLQPLPMDVSPAEWAMYATPAHRRAEFTPGGSVHTHIVNRTLGMARLTGLGDGNFFSSNSASTLFVHGGVELRYVSESLGVGDDSLEDINWAFHALVSNNDVDDLNTLMEGNSPVWTRVLAEAPEKYLCPLLPGLLTHFKVARVVVGHTPQEDMLAKTRCDGQIVLADVMMSRWMVTRHVNEAAQQGGRPVAIIMAINTTNGDLESMVAHYTDLRGVMRESRVLVGDPALEVLPPKQSESEEIFFHSADFGDYDFDQHDDEQIIQMANSLRRTTSYDSGIETLDGPKMGLPLPSYMRPKPLDLDAGTVAPASEFEDEEYFFEDQENMPPPAPGMMRFAASRPSTPDILAPTAIKAPPTEILKPLALRPSSPKSVTGIYERPIFQALITMTPGKSAVFDALFQGIQGLVHVHLDGAPVDTTLMMRIATTLGQQLVHVGTMEVPPALLLEGKAGGELPFFFVRTACTTPLEDAGDEIAAFAEMAVDAIIDITDKLHRQGLVIGQESAEKIFSAFTVNDERSEVMLSDWSHVRPSRSPSHMHDDLVAVHQAVGLFLSTIHH